MDQGRSHICASRLGDGGFTDPHRVRSTADFWKGCCWTATEHWLRGFSVTKKNVLNLFLCFNVICSIALFIDSYLFLYFKCELFCINIKCLSSIEVHYTNVSVLPTIINLILLFIIFCCFRCLIGHSNYMVYIYLFTI